MEREHVSRDVHGRAEARARWRLINAASTKRTLPRARSASCSRKVKNHGLPGICGLFSGADVVELEQLDDGTGSLEQIPLLVAADVIAIGDARLVARKAD